MTSGLTPLAWAAYNSQTGTLPFVTYNTDNVKSGVRGNSGGYTGVLYSATLEDLTQYKSILLNCNVYAELDSSIPADALCVWKKVNSGYYMQTAVASKKFTAKGTQTITLDISELVGSYYIGIGMRRGRTADNILTIYDWKVLRN